ncbi:MAG: HK97 family phage prohead protease [Rhizobiaceae bacterium]
MSIELQHGLNEFKFADVTLDTVDADGVFSGYASLFDVTDLARDSVSKGAFAKSLVARGVANIRMLFQHDPNEPIGQWLEIREDARGLFVKGRLALGVGKAREVLALLRDKALDGLSIGFKTIRSRKDAATGVRRILEADLWEVSVVTFPMLPSARIADVKAGNLPSIREFETWLRRDAGLSRSEARGVIAKGFATVKRERDAASNINARLATRLQKAAKDLASKGQ